MTTDTLAKLAACPFCGTDHDEIMLFIEEDGCRLQCAGCNIEAPYFETYDEAAAAWNRRALTAQALPAAEPFGYFKAEPFGWTDCAETDDGAIALYERPQAAQQAAQATAGWQPIETAPKDGTEIILRRDTRVGAGMWVKWPATEHEEAGEGWTIGFDGDSWDEEKAPTEWQPLPQPQPQSAQAKGDA